MLMVSKAWRSNYFHNKRLRDPDWARRMDKKVWDMRKGYRLEALIHYSGDPPRCVRCGFSDVRALQFDHINGGGSKHHEELKKLGLHGRIYEWLRRQGYPPGFQVLCANCNQIKRVENHEQ